VDRATGGRAAQANIAVLVNTARVAGRLAAVHASRRGLQTTVYGASS
jgi:pseudouridine-5'-phosphate glycosidase